jgi:inorganic pyrophosphatase
MPDFNKVLETGDYQNGLLNVVNEIPKGSTLKIEWDRERAAFTLDRVEPAIYAKPVNYGFIPKTLDEDGDELDVLIVTDEPIPTGVWLKTRILGVLNFVDDGENDHLLERAGPEAGKTLDQANKNCRQRRRLCHRRRRRHNRDLQSNP